MLNTFWPQWESVKLKSKDDEASSGCVYGPAILCVINTMKNINLLMFETFITSNDAIQSFYNRIL